VRRDFFEPWEVEEMIPHLPDHALRRSSARDRIRTGVDERIVMSVNGWRTRSVFDRYNITSEKDIEAALIRTQEYREKLQQNE
jgi:hypothetical protein